MTGPFETERQALDTPAVQAIYAAWRARPRVGGTDADNARMITGACDAAGVELGAYDRRIVMWLGGWGPQTCAVVAGLIARASSRPAEPVKESIRGEWGAALSTAGGELVILLDPPANGARGYGMTLQEAARLARVLDRLAGTGDRQATGYSIRMRRDSQ